MMPQEPETQIMPKIQMKCPECGSTNITKDALAQWDETAQDWTLAGVYDCETCQDCEAERDELALRVDTEAATPNGDETKHVDSTQSDNEGYPGPCPNRSSHSWVENEQTGATYCEYCTADGDA